MDIQHLVNETVREHIKACGNKIGSVAFIKKDGSIRHMRFQLAAGPSRVKGTELGKRMSATRAVNHPNLLNVWEIGNDWRSINLDTVLTVRSSGKITRYRQIAPIAPGRYALISTLSVRAGIEESVA
jgi:hypothetical protein